MVYELTTETVKPGRFAEFLERVSDSYRSIRPGEGGALLAAWTTEFGPLNQLVRLWGYTSSAERIRLRRRWVREDRRARLDGAGAPLLATQPHRLVLIPAAGIGFAPAARRSFHLWELRTYCVRPGKTAEWIRRFAAALPIRERYSPLAGLWWWKNGRRAGVCHLWVYRSLAQRADARRRAAHDPAWQAFLTRALPLLVSMHSVALLPVDVLRSTSPGRH